jgi:hypothetical protein
MYWDGGAATTAINISSDTNMPMTKMFAVHKGRIYMLSDNDVGFCGLNNSTDWTTASDAGTIDITRSVGVGTAIYAYADHVIVWSANSMHELWGSGPDTYELTDVVGDIGCIDQKTVCEVNGKLFWLDFSGVYLYTGGKPQKISNNVRKWIDGINWTYKNLCCASGRDDKLYMSIPYNSTSLNTILVYDTAKDTWTIQDGNFNHFTNISDTLYASETTSGKTWDMESTSKTGYDNSTAINWSFETGAFGNPTSNATKAVNTMDRMFITHEGSSTNGSLNVSYTTNAATTNGFTSLIPSSDIAASSDSAIDSETKIYRKIIPGGTLFETDWHKLKFAGTGYVTVHSFQENMTVREE